MRVLVTGGTGFIGQRLCRALAASGHEVTALTRSPSRQPAIAGVAYDRWDGGWTRAPQGYDAAVNLAGEPLVGKRWTPGQKRRLVESRVDGTRRLVETFGALAARPRVLVSASAVGYYGARDDAPLAEDAAAGTGFLAATCQAWEAAAREAERAGIRVVCARIGVVLGADGGALAKMVPPFRWLLGGPLGDGRQWVSWIHVDDVVALLLWALRTPEVRGALNATAPEPVRMRAFCEALGQALHRPSWAPVPAFALRLLLGEAADVLLTGQRAVPVRAQQGGYLFRYPELLPALRACVGAPAPS
jgi:hypothetical protein